MSLISFNHLIKKKKKIYSGPKERKKKIFYLYILNLDYHIDSN